MKTCLIYGHNGLDLDVTFNLIPFYERLGFKVFISDKLHDADLLVVLRAVDKIIDISPYKYSLIHVFDYGGWDFDAFIRSLNYKITYIFCTSELKVERIIEKFSFPSNQIYLSLPPVEISLWTSKFQKVEYEIVHIGNFKPIKDNDTIKERFNECIMSLKAHVWGLGWENKLQKNLYHGKMGLFDVSSVYSKSKFALGLMYPFQRNVTYSGRFWHAPLNGCFLFSEPGLYTSKVPGLIETDYTKEDIQMKLNLNLDRQELKLKAVKFWEEQNNKTLSYILPTLCVLKGRKSSLNKYLIYCKYAFFKTIKEYYQRMSLYRFIGRNR